MTMASGVRQGGATGAQHATLEGHQYVVLPADQVTQFAGKGARGWQEEPTELQEGAVATEFSIPLDDFSQGYGYTFADIPGVYELADGFVADAPGQMATYPELASLTALTDTDSRAWHVQHGGYSYVIFGRYAMKVSAADTPGETWTAIEYFDFETIANDRQVAGRPFHFQAKLYVPLRNAAGTLQRFIRLTTVSTTTTEVQTVAISGTPTSGTYTLTFDGKTTAAITFDADGPTVQAALRLIGGLQDVTVVTTGTIPNFTHTVTMTHAPSAAGTTSPPQMTSTDGTSGGAHAIGHATTVAGVGDQWDQGPANKEAVAFTVWQDKLVRGDGNEVETVSADPMTAADWGGLSPVGDSGQAINDLAVYDGELIVSKTDGPWGFDTNYEAYPLIPKLRHIINADNGIGMEEVDAYLVYPHLTGLIRWRRGAYHYVGAEQEGHLEGARSPGWGRVKAIIPYAHDTYTLIDDTWNGSGVVAALHPPTGVRQPVIPHMQQRVGTYIAGGGLAGLTSQPATVHTATVLANDATVGTTGWTAPSNAALVDSAYATVTGVVTSQYLFVSGFGHAIPTSATINGIRVDVTRRKTYTAANTGATSPGTGANFASIGTNAWTNPGNITASDNTYATNATAGVTQGLRASNFGFTVPTTATILGIKAEVERKASAAGTITRIGTEHAGADSSTDITITKPAGTADGDVMIAILTNNVVSPATLAGWTNVTTGGAGYPHVQLLWRLAGGAEGASYTFTGSSVGARNGAIVTFRGVDQTNPIDVLSSTLPGDNLTSVDAPSVTATVTNGYLLCAFAINTIGDGTDPSWTPPSGMTELVDRVSATWLGLEISALALVDSGATGTKTAVSTVQGNTAAQSVVLRPAGAADSRISLVKADGSASATNKSAAAVWPTTEAYASFGGAADLWGETWTAADINDADFGVVVSATVLGSATASVDHCRITVYYEDAGVIDSSVRLFKAGVVTGSNKATAAQWAPTTNEVVSYGGAADLWGTTWTPAEVNAATFGAGVSAVLTAGQAEIDQIAIFVSFTVAGAGDPGSYLLVSTLDAGRTVCSTVAYKLPRAGLPIANDPNINRRSGTVAAEFRTSRYTHPGRHVQKTYRVVEFYLEADIQANTPGFALTAKIDDGDEMALVDDDGVTFVAYATGYYHAFFPDTSASVGRWMQLIGRVPAVTGVQVTASYRVRDLIVRGSYDPEAGNTVTAYLKLEEGYQNLSAAQQRTNVLALRGPRTAPAAVKAPNSQTEKHAKVTYVQVREFQFNDETAPTYIATVKMRYTPYAGE